MTGGRQVEALPLSPVPIGERDLGSYAGAVGEETLDRVRAAARDRAGARVLHISSTPYGGGVAEHLSSHTALLRDLDIDVEWRVLELGKRFIEVTKALHNGLQGMPIGWDAEMANAYAAVLRSHARAFSGDWDLVVVHDPQPAALLPFLDERGNNHRAARWVWRCHVDVSDGGGPAWEFLRPFVACFDASIWTMEEFVPPTLDRAQARHIFPPSIDPLSPKNADLSRQVAQSVCRAEGIDPDRPLAVQVSRFDRWKDPIGVIEAFCLVREAIPDAQLVLIGSMAVDDPEGMDYWELATRTAAGIPDVHLLSDADDRTVNALQRAADVVVQKSIREGFGLTVSEALWKGRPVIGGRTGGIRLQIRDGVNGYLVDTVEQAGGRMIELMADRAKADGMGERGREHVREHFLITRELHDYLQLLAA